ncbi:MAG: hypothetical protein NVSMB65_03530 [Chloroflexota bacterium]
MYLRITRGRFDAAKYDDLLRLTTAIGAAIRALPGCQSYQAGLDRTGGRSISISTFDTADHAQFARAALGEALTRLQALGLQLDPPELYEVAP